MKTYSFILFLSCLTIAFLKVGAQQPLFNTYHVSLYKGKPASLKLKGNKQAEMFRTAIRTTYYSTKEQVEYHGANGLNFGGHYCFVYWGCGSECQDAAVVDLKTGIVYHALTASLGYDFKPNSRLVIVNPGKTIDSCAFCKPEYWVWNERNNAFKKIQ
jgi:hypothetical protein